jgi:hypothetical protein
MTTPTSQRERDLALLAAGHETWQSPEIVET